MTSDHEDGGFESSRGDKIKKKMKYLIFLFFTLLVNIGMCLFTDNVLHIKDHGYFPTTSIGLVEFMIRGLISGGLFIYLVNKSTSSNSSR